MAEVDTILADPVEPRPLAIRRLAPLDRFVMGTQGKSRIAFIHRLAKNSKAFTKQI